MELSEKSYKKQKKNNIIFQKKLHKTKAQTYVFPKNQKHAMIKKKKNIKAKNTIKHICIISKAKDMQFSEKK